MTTEYLKKFYPAVHETCKATTEAVMVMLDQIKTEGEEAVRRHARDVDGWTGDILIREDAFAKAERALSDRAKLDIAVARLRMQEFAFRQRASMLEFETEVLPGVVAGQKLIPCNTAGCYVSGGRHPHAANALSGVVAARVAGVRNIIAASPARADAGIDPAILHALKLAGADHVLALGGVPAVAALAAGLFTRRPADIVVGRGDRRVAEAKRMLFGCVGVDVVDGPSKSAIIADGTADPAVVTADLVGRAELGPDSQVMLITTSRALGEKVISLAPAFIAGLPEPARSAAAGAWSGHAEVVLCETREEMVDVSDRFASEHLQVMAADLDWWLGHLSNYGSLFLGADTTGAYAGKAGGASLMLPTDGAARHCGGLSVGKFIKTVSWQRVDRPSSQAAKQPAPAATDGAWRQPQASTGDRRHLAESKPMGGRRADAASQAHGQRMARGRLQDVPLRTADSGARDDREALVSGHREKWPAVALDDTGLRRRWDDVTRDAATGKAGVAAVREAALRR